MPWTNTVSVAPEGEAPHRHWHALHDEEALAAADADAVVGLSDAEAQRRLAHFGPNALPEPKQRSVLAVFVDQFKSPLIYLLFVAAGVAFLLGHTSDSAVILAVVLLNALVGSFQEGRAERSLQALRKLATHEARVVRDGRETKIDVRSVVPGDIVVLEAGDAVPADARLLDGTALQIAEAALTGESVPVTKALQPLAPDTPLADRRNMAYAGTHVTAGRGRAVVVATGLATEIGHIATLAEGAEELETPLERRIAQFGRYIMVAAAGIFVLILAVGLLRGLSFAQIVMVGISQVVSMIPEGLPVAVTVALAVGVQRMARRRAVVRRLAAIETLGSTTVICSDKTGTLTRNEMTVTRLCLPDGREVAITGVGYEPEGQLREGERELELAAEPELRALVEAVTLCNDAELIGPEDSEPRWKPLGDPTEVALLVLALKAGVIPSQLRERFPRRAEIPFDSAAKLMATQHDTPGGPRVFIKGAPEAVLELCRSAEGGGELGGEERLAFHRAVDGMAARALRVLAVAVAEGTVDGRLGFAGFRGRCTLLGLVGQIDPPRLEVKQAVAQCRAAGIRPVMVTGDHKVTGHAIALELGIAREGDIAVDGRELEGMSDAELERRIDSVSVFARVHPAQKLRIVSAYQKRGAVVAMTGDGVNDAPALVKADAGVAMGLSGTEVAKEAAKVVIGDDNFATIVSAVEEGRVVYRNIKKLILYLFSTSMAEVLLLLAALVLGYPPPLAAVQILWVNLVTDGVLTATLIMDPAEGDEMNQPPIRPTEPLLTRALLSRMAFMVPAIAVSTLGWFAYRLSSGVPFAVAQTETFTVLAVCQWFNVLSCRSEKRSALGSSLLNNPWLIGGLVLGNLLHASVIYFRPLGDVFHTVTISIWQAFAIGAVASLVLWVEELRKLVVRRRDARMA